MFTLLSVSNSFIGLLPLKGTGGKSDIHALNCGTYSYREWFPWIKSELCFLFWENMNSSPEINEFIHSYIDSAM